MLRSRRVDHEVGLGLAPDSSSSRSRSMASATDVFSVAERVAAPGGSVAAHQLGRRRLEEEDPHPVAASAATTVDAARCRPGAAPVPTTRATPVIVRAGRARQLDDLLDQLRAAGCRPRTSRGPRGCRPPVERPRARTTPVITRNVASRARPTPVQAALRQRKSSRGIVAASAYSLARARKPGGGAGSAMCSM